MEFNTIPRLLARMIGESVSLSIFLFLSLDPLPFHRYLRNLKNLDMTRRSKVFRRIKEEYFNKR